jgi:hypothetical protein
MRTRHRTAAQPRHLRSRQAPRRRRPPTVPRAATARSSSSATASTAAAAATASSTAPLLRRLTQPAALGTTAGPSSKDPCRCYLYASIADNLDPGSAAALNGAIQPAHILGLACMGQVHCSRKMENFFTSVCHLAVSCGLVSVCRVLRHSTRRHCHRPRPTTAPRISRCPPSSSHLCSRSVADLVSPSD